MVRWFGFRHLSEICPLTCIFIPRASMQRRYVSKYHANNTAIEKSSISLIDRIFFQLNLTRTLLHQPQRPNLLTETSLPVCGQRKHIAQGTESLGRGGVQHDRVLGFISSRLYLGTVNPQIPSICCATCLSIALLVPSEHASPEAASNSDISFFHFDAVCWKMGDFVFIRLAIWEYVIGLGPSNDIVAILKNTK